MNISIITGSRAEYGLLKPLILELMSIDMFNVNLVVTGSHLSPEFGYTYKNIENDGIEIAAKLEMLLSSDSSEGIVKSMALLQISFTEYIKANKVDLIIILGDRYEMLSIASTALIFKIPIVHIHGGEITEGAFDDSIRHAITKLSHIHFTSTEEYRNRVIQLGENPNTVYNVGAIGLDNITNTTLLNKRELENLLNIRFKEFNYLITFHPETLSNHSIEDQLSNLFNALNKFDDSFFIFTKSNADTNGRLINEYIKEYTEINKDKSILFDNLGTTKFLSVLNMVDAFIGNSSSGIIEAPSFKTATINIGDRQKGRVQSVSVINTPCDSVEIYNAILYSRSENFKNILNNAINPYGNGSTTKKIIQVLKHIKMDELLNKKFYNL